MPIGASVAQNDRYMQWAGIWRKQVWLGEKSYIAGEKKLNHLVTAHNSRSSWLQDSRVKWLDIARALIVGFSVFEKSVVWILKGLYCRKEVLNCIDITGQSWWFLKTIPLYSGKCFESSNASIFIELLNLHCVCGAVRSSVWWTSA